MQAAYLQLQAIAITPPAERGETVVFWPALVTIERAAEAVGKAARVEKRELDQFRRPLAERLEETCPSSCGCRRPARERVGPLRRRGLPAERGRHPVPRQGAGHVDLATRGGVGPVPRRASGPSAIYHRLVRHRSPPKKLSVGQVLTHDAGAAALRRPAGPSAGSAASGRQPPRRGRRRCRSACSAPASETTPRGPSPGRRRGPG